MDIGHLNFRRLVWASPAATAVVLVLAATLAQEPVGALRTLSAHASLISIEGSSPVAGLPGVKVEVPSPTGGSSLAEVTVNEKGATATTPVTPPVEVTVPKVEAPHTPSTPVTPVLEEVTKSTGSVGGSGSGGSGSSGSGSEGSGARSGSGGSESSGSGSGSDARSASASSRAAQPVLAPTPRTHNSSAAHRGSPKSTPAGGAAAGTGTAQRARTPGGPAAGGSGTAQKAATDHRASGSSDPLASLGSSLPLPLPVPDWSKPIILLLLLLVLALALRWRLATRRAQGLERRQHTLLRDIEVMQAALVPEVPELLDGLGISAAYRPAEGPAAGGDFYDVFALAPGLVAVILGDVAGHGHDAVRQAALTRYTLRAFLKETSEPRTTLTLAGHALSEPGVEQLATVAIALFDERRGTLTYALAGHPPPILLGTHAADVPTVCSSPPVGCEIPTGRRQRTISLQPGARVCLFSDGLIEARRSTAPVDGHPDLLGRERLAEMIAALPAEASAEDLLAAVRAAAAATPDDMAACILTPHLKTRGPTLDLEELEVDGRALDGGHLSSYLRASGLDEEGRERVLKAARTQLIAHDTAVLSVDRAGRTLDVQVRAGAEHREGAGTRRTAGPAALQRA